MTGPAPGTILDIDIDNLAFGGQGTGRTGEGFVVFVSGTAPGDRVRTRITRRHKRHAQGLLLDVIRPGPGRVKPPCPHFGSCGGCSWQNLDYAVQLDYKRRQVGESMERLGGISGFDLLPVREASPRWRYRNKLEFSVGRDESAVPAVGFHPPGRWDVVLPVPGCLLAPEEAEIVRRNVHEWLSTSDIEPWDPRTKRGILRQVTVRFGRAAGEVLVVLHASEGMVLAHGEPLHEIAQQLRAEIPGLVGVCVADIPNERSAAPAGSVRTLAGRPFVYEQVGDLRLKISAEAFFQTNSSMVKTLYDVAAEEAGLSGQETVWDLYSGIGSIALYLASTAESVLGVEIVHTAVSDANENAALNSVHNVHFLHGNARVVLKSILEERSRRPSPPLNPDVIVVDPPRGGLANKVVARAALAQPQRIVYVSCNPTTMAPNVALFQESGYRLSRITPVDMFPHTPHIEAVGLLVRSVR